ncbi:MAG: replication protein [Clostridia bacterium]|nr:replication protein [Clostridia bacterium]
MSITKNNYEMLMSSMLETGSLVIPDLLLKFYSRLGLTENEMMVLIHLIHWRQIEHERFPTPEKLSQYMTISEEEIKNIIASLIEKKFLTVEPYYSSILNRWQNAFSFSNLWSKLSQEALGDSDHSSNILENDEIATTNSDIGEVYSTFEKEFGRPLSPLENEQLREWCRNSKLSLELIHEALKRAVLRGALNFRYIDSILRDWQHHNIRTVAEAINHDEKKNKKKVRRSRSETRVTKKGKYDDLYRLVP